MNFNASPTTSLIIVHNRAVTYSYCYHYLLQLLTIFKAPFIIVVIMAKITLNHYHNNYYNHHKQQHLPYNNYSSSHYQNTHHNQHQQSITIIKYNHNPRNHYITTSPWLAKPQPPQFTQQLLSWFKQSIHHYSVTFNYQPTTTTPHDHHPYNSFFTTVVTKYFFFHNFRHNNQSWGCLTHLWLYS